MRSHLPITEVCGGAVAIGLLAAFALPMIANGKRSAARSGCMENLKQIGTALAIYSRDWDDTFPRTTAERPRFGLGVHWAILIQPYLRNEKMFVCPADTSPSLAEYNRFSRKTLVPRISYINNYSVISAHDFFPVGASILGRPEEIIVLTERRKYLESGPILKSWKGASGFQPGQPCRGLKLGDDYNRVTQALAERMVREAQDDKELLLARVQWNAHGSGSNYTFADSHASFQTIERTLRPDHYQWGERFYPTSMPDAECDASIRKP